MRAFYFLFGFLIISCQNNPDLVNNFFSKDNFPIEVISDSKMIHTEDGIIKLQIDAKKIERYLGDSSRLDFSNGFNVNFYNNLGNITSNLSALNAVVDEKNNIMVATDSVILKSTDKKLETEILIWDQKKEKVYTDEEVVITTANEVIYAQGFISDPNFSDYTLKKISGKMYVNSLEN
jgi:LPS export ABC transporter protein LptC